jgi:iron complex outermembrane receptor protein
VQKTDYRKETDTPTGALPISEDDPWLINGTAAAYLGESLVAYASYARGLEESPRPPENAVNSSDAPPAIRTEQVDGGLRWAVTERLSAVGGLFEVSKPFYDLDPANRFAQQGTVRHRGVELSLAGQLATGLNLVAGTVFLDAEVSGAARDAGLVGKKPVATIERNSFASLDWRIPESPFSVDAVFESTGERVANQANTLVIPPRSVLSLGGRYRFAIAGKPATVRAQVGNIFNNYGFGATGGGLLVYNLPRRFAISLAADL